MINDNFLSVKIKNAPESLVLLELLVAAEKEYSAGNSELFSIEQDGILPDEIGLRIYELDRLYDLRSRELLSATKNNPVLRESLDQFVSKICMEALLTAETISFNV